MNGRHNSIRSQEDVSVAIANTSDQKFSTDYKHNPRVSFSAPRYPVSRVSRGGNAQSEGVITWHSQGQNLDLLWNDNSVPIHSNSITNSRNPGAPASMPSQMSREYYPTHNSPPTTTTHNLHQKLIGELTGQEVLSPMPPKVLCESNVWSTTQARHRRSSTARQSKGHHVPIPPLPSTTSPLDTPAPALNVIPTSNPPCTTLARSSTIRHKSMPTIEIPSIANRQKDTHLPLLSWKRVLEPALSIDRSTPTLAEPTRTHYTRTPSISNLSDIDDSIQSTTSLFVKLPQVSSQHHLVWDAHNSQNSDEDKEVTCISTTNTTSFPSNPPSPTSPRPTFQDAAPPVATLQTHTPIPTSLTPTTSPLPTPQASFQATTSHASTSPDPASPKLEMDENIIISLTVLLQHHTIVNETLGARLAILRSTSHLVACNGGWPCGVPFALEHVLTHGDVAAIVDIAKLTYSISDNGEDESKDQRDGMDTVDYKWVTVWLSAVPVMIEAMNANHVLVGLRVLVIILPILEQWVETAVGIACSLGSDAIPDELREQCCHYNEKCKVLHQQISRLERKGHVGVVANEVHILLCNFLSKLLP
eukprot:Phypoly_transcript_05461.p1 GENE.Phypoly_transcript_05461~~Phypoly_transcript_05461.p1  ORF type:complete len:588 (+),score=75.43 Phypoly_transcript_05461:48-1811(+)